MVKRGAKKSWVILMILMLFVMLVTACGSAKNADRSESADKLTVSDSANKADMKTETSADAETVTSESQASLEKPQAASVGAGAAAGEKPIDPGSYERKLIYKANVTIEVTDYAKAQRELQNRIQLAGGYLLQFADQQSTYELGGNYTIKVPQQGFMDFMKQIEQIDHQLFEQSVEGQDVTEEYVDLESRLKAKQVVEKRLLGFMEKAANSGDLLKISSQLADVQEQIEQVQGRMRYLDQNVAYSTVSIRLYQPIESANKQVKASDIPFVDRMGKTLSNSMDGVVVFFQGFILVVIALLPVLIILAVIGIPVFYYWRKRKRKNLDI
ncbi:hypothetical protein BVG16_11300 [Paenibacillus selenitireducens]|uniref:DUF4349 domain-containing protein n=1 Tax=Paenibacillus selenitireducens TaxID=1324314 RepID=A0A1T2XFJ4_9BACL|nr:DUF4349 domain-containing protein [Paenibacillus selenitireducens]OPA78456.1 hypothetical protein BVG16_11300 [Paenibacillus selenitireducens]